MENDLVLLQRVYDLTEAHMIRGLLESNDIQCFLLDENHSSLAWHMTVAIGGVRVMVFNDDFENAKTLIQQSEPADPTIPPQPWLKKPYVRNILLSLFGLFSGAPLVMPDKQKD